MLEKTTYAKFFTGSERVLVKNVKLAKRTVRMIVFSYGGSDIPLSKAKILAEFGTKKEKDPLNEHRKKTVQAFRNAIEPQIKEFRASIDFPTRCHFTYEPVYTFRDIDIDHSRVSFAKLMEDFLILKDFYIDEIELEGPPTNKRIKNKALLNQWQEYHRDKAKLVVCSKAHNRSKGAKDFNGTSRLTRPNDTNVIADF